MDREVFYVDKEDKIYSLCEKDRETHKYKEIVEIRLPRVLLRHMVQSYPKWLFYTFWNNVKLFSSRVDQMESIFICIYENSESFGFSKYALDCISKEKDKRSFSIFITLYIRVALLSEMIDESTDCMVSYYAKLYLDTHLDLAIDIIQHGYYKNEFLISSDHNPYDEWWPILNQCYPHDLRFTSQQDIISTWPFIYSCGSSQEMSSKKKEKGFFAAVVRDVFTKSRVLTCQKRGIVTMVNNSCKSYGDITNHLSDIVYIFLMGNAPISRVNTNFEARMRIHNFMKREGFFTKKYTFEKFLFTFEKTVIFAIRYVVMNELARDPVFFGIRKLEENTMQLMSCALDVSDEIRKVYRTFSNEKGSIFEKNLEYHIRQVEEMRYTDFLRYSEKVNRNDVIKVIYKKMDNVYKQNVKDSPYISFLDPVSVIGVDTTAKLHVYAREEIRKITENRYYIIKFDFLKQFVDEEVYSVFLNIYNKFIYEESPENSLLRVLKTIIRKSWRCYAVLYFFFSFLFHYHEMRSLPIPEHIRKRQRYALMKKYMVLPWVNTIKHKFVFFICTNCGKWANHVAKPNDVETMKSMNCKGPNNCAISIHTGQLVCRSSSERQNVRYQNGDNKNPKKKDKNKANLRIRKVHKYKCSSTDLTKINMEGIIQKTTSGDYYSICTICGVLCLYKTENFSSYGFTCCNHWRENPKELPLQNGERCFWCERTFPSLFEMTMFDDETKPYKLRKIYLCQKHQEYWYGRLDTRRVFPSMSEIRRMIYDRLDNGLSYGFRK